MKRYMEYRFGQAYTPRKKHRLRNTVGIIVLIILISAISIGIQFAIQYSIVEDIPTWTSSLPSYWGGIVGGAISGTISIVGVYLTIKYYRDSDASKSRIEHMPFIYIKLIDAHKVEAVDLSKAKVIEVPNRKYEIDKGNKMLIDLELENIGNGFANTLVLHLGNNLGGEQYSKLIKVNETVHLQLKFYVDDAKNTTLDFGLQYIDCMTNEYVQVYTIDCKKHSLNIDCGYPRFIGQAHSIGN